MTSHWLQSRSKCILIGSLVIRAARAHGCPVRTGKITPVRKGRAQAARPARVHG